MNTQNSQGRYPVKVPAVKVGVLACSSPGLVLQQELDRRLSAIMGGELCSAQSPCRLFTVLFTPAAVSAAIMLLVRGKTESVYTAGLPTAALDPDLSDGFAHNLDLAASRRHDDQRLPHRVSSVPAKRNRARIQQNSHRIHVSSHRGSAKRYPRRKCVDPFAVRLSTFVPATINTFITSVASLTRHV